MNDRLLRAKMVEAGETQKDLAHVLEISLSRMNMKLHGNGAEFKLKEIRKIKEHYNLTSDEVDQIFFGEEVS